MLIDEKNCVDSYCQYYKEFEEPIKRSLSRTSLQEREDLEQEILLKIFQKAKNLSFKKEAPKFWDFFDK
ncbi:hypothetical protein ACQJ0K_28525 [Priestia megaterium]|uniref:hypothetical protein n=1 Tax=Priestia megaterium TaxID=1404 RepID=UPI003CE9A5EB